MPAIGYHFVAFLTVAIWGSTFVFTKILLQHGLSPAQILTLRFIIAYVLMVASLTGTCPLSDWVYFNPVTTILFAWWLLSEQITLWFLLGSLLIIIGMILSDRKTQQEHSRHQ